jgi:dihydroorotase
MLPLLLESARQGELSYERVVDLVAHNPAEIFDLDSKGRVEPGYDADLVLVDPDDSREIRGDDTHSKCDWTPFEGMEGVFPELTIVRGQVIYNRQANSEVGRDCDIETVDPNNGHNIKS